MKKMDILIDLLTNDSENEKKISDLKRVFAGISQKNRLWDNDVPVILDEEHNCIDAYITGSIAEPNEYNELCYELAYANEHTTFNIHINTTGGIIDSAFMIAEAIFNSKAHVIAHLTGTVASAGTIIALACHELTVARHLTFMIHNYSGGMAGKGHEMKARQRFVDDHLNHAFESFYAGFLTSEEMQRVIEGSDFWMGSKEVEERWEKRKAYLNV